MHISTLNSNNLHIRRNTCKNAERKLNSCYYNACYWRIHVTRIHELLKAQLTMIYTNLIHVTGNSHKLHTYCSKYTTTYRYINHFVVPPELLIYFCQLCDVTIKGIINQFEI